MERKLLSQFGLPTRHAAFKAVTSVRCRIQSFWKGLSLPYPEPGIRLIRQDDIAAFDVQMTSFSRGWVSVNDLRPAPERRTGSASKPFAPVFGSRRPA